MWWNRTWVHWWGRMGGGGRWMDVVLMIRLGGLLMLWLIWVVSRVWRMGLMGETLGLLSR